jgi:hypothetical protein
LVIPVVNSALKIKTSGLPCISTDFSQGLLSPNSYKEKKSRIFTEDFTESIRGPKVPRRGVREAGEKAARLLKKEGFVVEKQRACVFLN